MILDATAGNRMIWNCKNPPNTIFIDKEIGLYVSPTLFADFRQLPFRDNLFDCVLFDPPHSWGKMPPWWNSPQGEKNNAWANYPKSRRSWYGSFKNKFDMLSSIHKAQTEFGRVSSRLCLKWSELKISLWNILPFFKEWKLIQTKPHKGKYKVGKTRTYWVTFIREQDKA